MLKLTWIAKHTGAPSDDSWQRASDVLYEENGASATLQRFPRTDWLGPIPSVPLANLIRDWTPGSDTAVVMVHGWDFDPTADGDGPPADDPYHLVFGPERADKPRESWLSMIDATGTAKRAVAFAWTSTSTQFQAGNAGWSNPYQHPVLDLAPLAARALATVILALNQAGLKVDILAHSLGTRVALQAVGLLGHAGHPDAVERAVLLGCSEYCCDAEASMAVANPTVFNFVNRADPVLSLGAEEMLHPFRAKGTSAARVAGRQGLKAKDWIDIQLDSPSVRDWYKAKGYAISDQPCDGRGMHWAHYHQPENRRLIAALLDHSINLPWFQDAPRGVHPCDYSSVAVPRTPPDAATRIAMNNELVVA